MDLINLFTPGFPNAAVKPTSLRAHVMRPDLLDAAWKWRALVCFDYLIKAFIWPRLLASGHCNESSRLIGGRTMWMTDGRGPAGESYSMATN